MWVHHYMHPVCNLERLSHKLRFSLHVGIIMSAFRKCAAFDLCRRKSLGETQFLTRKRRPLCLILHKFDLCVSVRLKAHTLLMVVIAG